MTEPQLLDKLRRMVKARGEIAPQKMLALELDVSESYLCDILKGKRSPGPTILKALGLRRVIVYEKEQHGR